MDFFLLEYNMNILIIIHCLVLYTFAFICSIIPKHELWIYEYVKTIFQLYI